MPLVCSAGPGSRLYTTPPAAPENGSLTFIESSAGNYERAVLPVIPDGFGDGEFTCTIFFRCLSNGTYALGSTASGTNQLRNWSNDNSTRYGSSGWWFPGNFLLDGHQNSSFSAGTFSVQIAAGRPRWLFGDGAAAAANTGGVWGIQSAATETVLDNAWHRLDLIRRWNGGSNADLELWLDGSLQDTQTTTSRTNMATTYWDSWTGYPSNQNNWMFGTEKQAALGVISQYEDFKGQLGQIRFWSAALSSPSGFADVAGNETNLVGLYRFDEGTGTSANNSISVGTTDSMTLAQSPAWSALNPF
ncbi:MAG: hypothetical protein LLG14_27230 [Nocardiaceae bacterium]|nr:hypothetical protein [Nocardiaceae bacterium]